MKRSNRPEAIVAGPDEALYIYYLKGRVAPDIDLSAPGFVGNWEEDGFSFLFYTRACRKTIAALLAAQPQLEMIDAYQMAYADWLGERPVSFCVGRFDIVPVWEIDQKEHDAGGNLQRLILDPGVVFGSGTHATTRDCLRALEIVYDEDRPEAVIDLGTGTGVLALAATALGSRSALAVDNNLLAVRTAARNFRMNGMADRILAVQGRAEAFIEHPGDLLLANIHYDVMRLLVKSAGFLQKKWFILSGLMHSQAGAIAEQLRRIGSIVRQQWIGVGPWHTFLGKNPRLGRPFGR
jgi:ribosomal protein L11 methyltransferase